MTDRTCAICAEPLPGHDQTSTICATCANSTLALLKNFPELDTQTNLTISRQAAIGERTSRKGSEKPLPFATGASDTLTEARAALRYHALTAIEGHPTGNQHWTAVTLTGYARILIANHQWLTHHPDAYVYVTDIAHHHGALTRAIDIHPQPTYLAPCNAHTHTGKCTTDLYARPGARNVRCDNCGTVWTVDEKRREAYLEAIDRTWPITEARHILRRYGIDPAPIEKVNRWVTTGRLTPRGHNLEGRNLYHLDDLLRLHGAK